MTAQNESSKPGPVTFVTLFVALPCIIASVVGMAFGAQHGFTAFAGYALLVVGWTVLQRGTGDIETDPDALALEVSERESLRGWVARFSQLPFGADEIHAAALRASEGLCIRVTDDEMLDAVRFVEGGRVAPRGPRIEWPPSKVELRGGRVDVIA